MSAFQRDAQSRVVEHRQSTHHQYTDSTRSAMVASSQTRLDKSRELAPPRTGWMRNDGIWPLVQPCITRFVPKIDIGQSRITPTTIHEQCSNHTRTSSRSNRRGNTSTATTFAIERPECTRLCTRKPRRHQYVTRVRRGRLVVQTFVHPPAHGFGHRS